MLQDLLERRVPEVTRAFLAPLAAYGELPGLLLLLVLSALDLGVAGVFGPVCGLPPSLWLEIRLRKKAADWQGTIRMRAREREALTEETMRRVLSLKLLAWDRVFFRRLALARDSEREAMRRDRRAAAQSSDAALARRLQDSAYEAATRKRRRK